MTKAHILTRFPTLLAGAREKNSNNLGPFPVSKLSDPKTGPVTTSQKEKTRPAYIHISEVGLCERGELLERLASEF